MQIDDAAVAQAVVAHFAAARRDLPWRRTRDPYAIWVSEVMLQQTRVTTVIPYWEKWMAKFPTVRALAAAPLDDVLGAWAGLGYYSRARRLHAGAVAVGDALPRRASELRAVPGIGPYTAGAIASIAYGERAPLVDGNVARVLARVYGIAVDIKSTAGTKALWRRAGAVMTALAKDADPGALNQGLMELGATVCTPTQPRCLACPLVKTCVAAREGRQDELPVTTPRKKASELPVLARTLVWISDGVDVVLARRRPDGLFGGLWELPEQAAVEREVSIDAAPVAYHDQTLSHRRLRVTVVRGALSTSPPGGLVPDDDPRYDAIARVRIADAARLGIAAATSAILSKYEDNPWSSIPRPSASSPRATRRSSKASAVSATTPKTPISPKPRRGRRKASTSSSTIRSRSKSR